MLIVFPLGLWIFGLITYIVFLSTGHAVWDTVAWYSIAGGIIGAVLAAAAGFADLLGLPASPARTVGVWHLIFNVAALGLFVVALAMRWSGQTRLPLVLLAAGTVCILVSGWLGGSMVYVHGVGISQKGIEDHLRRQQSIPHGEAPGIGPYPAQPLPG
jgi:uncharacterized membrane protein